MAAPSERVRQPALAVSLRVLPGQRRCVMPGVGMRLRGAIRVSSARKTGDTRNATTQTPSGARNQLRGQASPAERARQEANQAGRRAAWRHLRNSLQMAESRNRNWIRGERRTVGLRCIGANQPAPSSHDMHHRATVTDEVPSGFMIGYDIRRMSLTSRDGGIRTRGLLLPNQPYTAAGCRSLSPSKAFACGNVRLLSPNVAWCLCTLAPTLAPSLGSQTAACTNNERPTESSFT